MTLEYEVTVFTADPNLSWSLYKSLNITLEGTRGKSEVTSYHKFNLSFFGSNEIKFPVKCSSDLGHLVGIKLEAYWSIPFQSPWYHVRVEAESPIGTIYRFPIHQSIFADKEYFFREGKAMLPQKEKIEELIKHRQKEIKDQQKIYRWKVFEKGMPHCLESDTLPLDETYSFSKNAEFGLNKWIEGAKLIWTAITECMDALRNLDQVEDLLKKNLTAKSEYVMNNWK
ncbi:arachidonate 12-lipoxygenase, 12R-type, partial [Oryzias melastigma]|uniref:arachidonate 12-lipoxygenase, 12R-type n=1 Tax=Oryzias melastigma TaxID=30732 RepID=UPI000CF83159